MVKRILDDLKDIDVISLFCTEELEGFYELSGFKRTKQIVMHYKNQGIQKVQEASMTLSGLAEDDAKEGPKTL